MIQKIGSGLVTNKTSFTASKKETQTTQPQEQQPKDNNMPVLSSRLLHSYFVSFGSKKDEMDFDDYDEKPSQRGRILSEKAKMNEIENNVSYYGEKLLNDSRKLAQKYNHKEINQIHVLRTGLESVNNYIDQLNSGEISYGDESSFSTKDIFEDILGKNVFKEQEKRNKVKKIIEEEISILDEELLKMPKTTNSANIKNKKLEFSKDFLNDIYSLYKQDNEEDMGGDGLVHDATIFDAAIFPNNDQIKKKIVIPFRTALKDQIQIDTKPLSKRIHLSFYDDKAQNIWKNLAVGTNMVILHDKDLSPSYLINSFLHVFENSTSGFGNLTKDNTEIVNFNDNGELDNNYIKNKLHEFGKNKNKNKNYVMIMSIMDSDLNTLAIDNLNIETFINAPKNVKFVMVADKDTYYKESNDKGLQKLFGDFGEISMPLMNMNQTKKMFKEQPKLIEKIKKPFSAGAIDKCVEAANQLKGNYPEKAQKVMDLVSAYYIDKDRINVSDVQNYVKEAKEIFKPVENDSAIKIVFDTGIKLKDMVGSPSTKKEAKSIVDRIKDKSIGTKGFIIYSQDGSVGAGRKYTAQAIAGEAKTPYIEINAVDFGTKDVDLFGGGILSPEASMKKLFSIVKSQAETNPSKSAVLFIENFEYFSYGEMVSEYHEKAMSQLIREMNKAQEQGLNIIIMGSMSDSKYIGEATTKSFKFIDEIEVESPGYNPKAREEIIDYYIKKKGIKLAGNEQEKTEIKKHINMLTEHASYIEILTLLDKAKNVARERKHKLIEKGDFTEALLQLTTGRPASKEDPLYEKEMIASHECGHALNATVMENLANTLGKPWHRAGKLSFITLDPRGWYGGCVHTSDMENGEYSFERIFSEIVLDFGGNSCEHRFYSQDGSWGITSDMQMATDMASQAVVLMGQGKHFGKKSMNGMWVISEEDKANINKDIDVILKNAQVVSDAITEVYEDFNREFTKKYASKVGTGDCIIQREDFIKMFEEWKQKQSPEKQKEMKELDKVILQVIEATKKGIVCKKAEN